MVITEKKRKYLCWKTTPSKNTFKPHHNTLHHTPRHYTKPHNTTQTRTRLHQTTQRHTKPYNTTPPTIGESIRDKETSSYEVEPRQPNANERKGLQRGEAGEEAGEGLQRGREGGGPHPVRPLQVHERVS